MPLLTSPVDGSPMHQIRRFGIELDVCPTSGGVWLDKGELEKLMALIKEAAEEEAGAFSSRRKPEERYEEPRYRDEEYRKPHYKEQDDYHYKGKHKKKGALHQMMEIFDF
ncbi:MAG: zf-TFIIB domain-containing protein [Rickettsiales bacterium]|nr:zf-TFIIB domain-containing protein [Pseudomonadota bacterium]MDA0965399.1 zf-TFIIB domain-containing protein [Pseudomonadota bacterium]MDG4542724.1 zf-TFIIB domain-containing protein [Rickettsiales bacterium]MDG4544828.1 zf-TFIIB domain-containing protein [Rickettsiales bacterium]MDG4546950.1 zf-TFIIB domain-containing protein [Rickettsiales bacterium]